VVRSNVALIGFMCAGKSSVGRYLAERLQRTFVETDELIEKRTGMSIADIFALMGEEGFRRVEADVVREVATGQKTVIACGGGVPLREENVRALRQGTIVVYLDVTPEQVMERLGPLSSVRPLLAGPDREQRARELLAVRRPLYIEVADIVVPSDDLTIPQVAGRLTRLLKEYERTHREE